MEPQRNTHPPEAAFQPSPYHHRDQIMPSIDVDETMSNVFSSLNISSTARRRPEIGGGRTLIGSGEGSVVFHPFRTNAAGGGSGSSSDFGIYSGVGHVNPLMVDPRSSSRFDQPFDFDHQSSSSDLLHKEHLYPPPQHLNHHLFSSSAILDETFNPNSMINNSNLARSRYYQLLTLLPLKELRGNIYSLAKDQNGCRLLQAKFENPTKEEIEMVLYEVFDSIKDLMKDQFGNYLIQKLIVVCNDDQKFRILVSLTETPVELILVCMSPHGTRAVQKLLENLTESYQIALAIAALGPGAARLANDQNGHHVIQYCLIHFPCDMNEPILNEIAEKCFEVATDRSGCCVLQACMENSRGEVRNRLISRILINAIPLAQHPYGNYVLQHMVGLNVPKFTAQLVRVLRGNFASLSCNKYGSNVVEKCLNESREEISTLIVMELVATPNPALLLTDPYANFVIQCALSVSTGFVYECLREVISDNIGPMRTNLYGKKILAWFEKRRILGI